MLNRTVAEWRHALQEAEAAIDSLRVQPGLSRRDRASERSKLIDVCVDARFYIWAATERAI